ncbi:CMRF35-like molecule 1 [Terrapene carolina triunguis]|uniref:CMRF35-like molecule 1 n=1 Tax=Terrapene triunguis TaxID=2587831 RepID=UPI000E7739F6|nr:CMRF35-like molecule 1 [Terrapene carolina triunguis]
MQLSFAGVILFLAGYSSGLAALELTGPGEVGRPLGESVSVQCQYHERYQGNRKYWCRGTVWRSCHTAVKTTGSEAEVKGDRVSIRDNHRLRTFTVTMETLTLGDAGIYWCGISKFGFDPGVPVKVTVLPGYFSALAAPALTAPREVSGPPGGTVSVPCQYSKTAQGSQKYWCRGAQWNSCSKVVETEKSEVKVKQGRVSITDNHTTRTFTVTMENLTLEDAGIYWCGINIKGGGDPYFLVNVTVLPALSTAVMVTTGSLAPVIGTTNTAEHPKSSPFTSAMFLLPMLLLVLLILLSGAMLLARRMMLKRKKAAGAVGPSAAVNEAVASTESDVSYAAVKPKSRKSITTAPSPHSAQAEPSPEGVEYSAVAPGMTDISYATVKYPILDEQAIYINVDRSSSQPPLSSPLEQTEYCAVKKK